MTATRATVAEFADRVVTTLAQQDPALAAVLGVPAEGLTDYGPQACAERVDAVAGLAAEAVALDVADGAERVARDVLVERLAIMRDLGLAEEYLRDCNVLSSPPQAIRMALELLPPGNPGAEALDRLNSVPASLAGWRESLQLGADRGRSASRRQAVAVAAQLRTYADEWLPGLASRWGARSTGAEAVADAVARAAAAFADAATWLADVYAVAARPDDAAGEETYQLFSRYHNGMEVDLGDTFVWGFEEIERLAAELRAEAAELEPGLTLTDLRPFLDADPRYRIEGEASLVRHLEQLTSRAADELDGRVFDIDPRIRTCEVRIAAEGAAAAPYYVPPSEDLSRPGSTWYPTRGGDIFPRWWLESVWYHEGVPGHHLQLGSAAVSQSLTRFQRTVGFTSGHAEGWAMYAERLCDELGWFDESGTRIGFLSGQLMRAVRVVVDIGMHTGRTVPQGFRDAGAHVDARFARRLLVDWALLAPDFAASEIDRYLGMPAQAISYKIGEREWLAARHDAQRAAGPSFDLRAWHTAALRLGPMGLAQFRRELETDAR